MDLIFSEPWWLDAVAPGRWEEVSVSKGNGIRGRFLFVRQRHWSGIVKITSPPLTSRLGPLIEVPGDGKLSRRLADQKSIMTELIAELPPHDLYAQNCMPEFDYWLPFHWAGFEQTTRYSYVFDDLTDEQALWRGLSQSHRRKITKGGDQYELRYDLDAQVLIDLVTATYARQGLDLFVEPSLVKRVHAAGLAHDAARQIVAVDRNGRALAAALVVWDANTAYYLIGGRADHDGPDAMPLVLWDAVKVAAKVSVRFDFEGSMIEGIEQFFRGFGARPEPYSFLTRASRRMKLLLMAQDLAKLAGRSR